MKQFSRLKGFLLIVSIVVLLFAMGFNVVDKKVSKTNTKFELTAEERRAMTYNLVTDEDEKIEGNEYVRFSAYFLRDLDGDGYAEKYDGSCRNINENAMLYMDINVLTEGKLTDGVIEINGRNFRYEMSMIEDDVLKNNYISSNVNKIELKDMNAGTQKLILGKAKANLGFNINNYSRVNTIKFEGYYVPLEGQPVKISKTINLQVDWYGTTRAEFIPRQKYEANYENIENDTIEFEFRIKENNRELIYKDNVNKIKIPELCGFAPISVKCTSSGANYEYDEQNKELIISRTSLVTNEGVVNTQIANDNTYKVSVKYPEEAYRKIVTYETLKFDMEGYYTGYNNQNEEFQNPYKSNVDTDYVLFMIRNEPKENIYNFYVDYIDKNYIGSPFNQYLISIQDIINMYNGDEINDKDFTVRWQAVRGNQGNVSSMIMSETKSGEQYGDRWSNRLIDDYISNTGIYFEEADQILGENGSISVFDNDTNELIKVFTQKDWNNYSKQNPYEFGREIKHLRVETSTANMNSRLMVYNVKTLNVAKLMNDFTLDEVKNIGNTQTYLTGICNIDELGPKSTNKSDIAYFIYDRSEAYIKLSKKNAIVYEELKNEKISINVTQDAGRAKWKNGQFLVEVPQEIVNMNINSVTTDNENVVIKAYELYQNDSGKYFIRVLTENSEPEYFTITIDCNILPNPKAPTVNKEFKLYGFNEFVNEYRNNTRDIYDVNQNGNLEEYVTTASDTLAILAPTSLITFETITDYDKNVAGEETVAPNVALVNDDENKAKINVYLTNNYENMIKGFKVLGKIPHTNNSYTINGKSLKSEFNTQMTSEGIRFSDTVSSAISSNSIIYYSEKLNPTKDLEDLENGWKTKDEITDWSKVNSYLICADNCTLYSGQKVTLNYDVILPENVELNSSAYSAHAIYFCLNTEDGLLNLNTEPTKVGLKIVRKYDFQLTKFKLHSELKIPQVTYAVSYKEKDTDGVLQNKQYICTTDENGIINLEDLFVGVEYVIKEIKVPDECEFDDREISFIVNADGTYTVNGQYKNKSFENNKLSLDLEDEIRAKVRISKTKLGTDFGINNVYFDAVDEDGNHITAKTKDGIAELTGISLGKTYTVTETATPDGIRRNDGVFTFRLTRIDESNINFETLDTSLLTGECVFENNVNELSPVIKINVENELRYSLNITKKNNENQLIRNAEFSLKGENDLTEVTLKTNVNGTCSFRRLNLGETYTLKETKCDGYYIDSENDYITFKVERDGVLKITKFEKNGNIDENIINQPEIQENGIVASLDLVLKNEKIPTYDLKIVKKNKEGQILTGAKFKLTRLYDNKEENITVDENGEAVIRGLYENIDGKSVSGVYELEETFAPDGYKLSESKLKFSVVRDDGGNLVFTGIEGMKLIKNRQNADEKEIETDENLVTLGLVNSPIFSLIKFGENDTVLARAKFIITDLEDNPAEDVMGMIVGVLENGKYVLETDIEGKITAKLRSGLYKAEEIEAPEGYELSNEKYYFGVDESQDAVYSDIEAELSLSKNYDDCVYEHVYSAIDSGLIAYGTSENTGVFSKLDDDGISVWSKSCTQIEIANFEKVDDDKYEVIAKCTTGNFNYDGNVIATVQDKDNYVIFKIGVDGDFIEGSSFVSVDDSSFVGFNEYNNILVQKENEIVEYDRQGTLINTISFELPVKAVIKNSVDGYLALFYTDSASTINGDIDLEKGAYLVFYDLQGNYKWYKKIGDNVSQGYTISKEFYTNNIISVTDENTFLVQGNGRLSTSTHGFKDKHFIMEVDKEGIIKNNSTLELIQNAYIPFYVKKIKTATFIMNDGTQINGYLLTGFNYISNTNFNNENIYTNYGEDGYTYEKAGFILALDNELNLLWFDKANQCPNDIEKVGNKYYLVGKQINDNPGQFDRFDGISIVQVIPELKEIEVHNELKKYIITTEIGRNLQGQFNGGTITGEVNYDLTNSGVIKVVEQVKHGYDSSRDILIHPDEGYDISTITINNEKVFFESDENGNITIPGGYFQNMTEDKKIVVTFEKKESKRITVKKIDNQGNPVKGAKVELKEKAYNPQLGGFESQTSTQSTLVEDEEKDQSELIGPVSCEYTYHFDKDDQGRYIPNNLSTTGYALSYIPVDLTNYSGEFYLKASCKGTAQIQIYVSETTENYEEECFWVMDDFNDYTCKFTGGRKIYLILECYNSIPNNEGVEISYIKLYRPTIQQIQFTENNGVYEPNNASLPSTTANGYIPLDLTNCLGKYKITVNAEIDNNSGTGLVNVKTIQNSVVGTILSISGTKQAQDYSLTLDGGKSYKIFLQYSKGSGGKKEDSTLENEFRINSIRVEQVFNKVYGVTDSNGEAVFYMTNLGEYVVKEVEAPEGYALSDEVKDVEITNENPHPIVTLQNEKLAKVIVHHLLQGTGPEYSNEPVVLADEEILEGLCGKTYTTSPNMEIDGYVLIKDSQDKYIIPGNATGEFQAEEQNVYYYYDAAPVKLTVHHYLEGTTTKLAEDEVSGYNKGEHYETNPSAEVLEKYDLVNVLGDEEKDILEDEEVTYFYKIKKHEITTRVELQENSLIKGGEIYGEGEAPYEVVEHGKSNLREIKMTPDEGHKIDEIVINKSENGNEISTDKVEFTPDVDGTFSLPQINSVESDYEIVVKYAKDQGKVIVHHYIEGTETKIAPDETTMDNYGVVVKTNPVNLAKYELVQSPQERNVEIEETVKEVIYYYQAKHETTTEVDENEDVDDQKPVDDESGKDNKDDNSNKEDKSDVDDVNIVDNKIEESNDVDDVENGSEISNNDISEVEAKPESNKVKSPQTGDNILVFIIIDVLAICLMFIIKKKSNKFVGKHF